MDVPFVGDVIAVEHAARLSTRNQHDLFRGNASADPFGQSQDQAPRLGELKSDPSQSVPIRNAFWETPPHTRFRRPQVEVVQAGAVAIYVRRTAAKMTGGQTGLSGPEASGQNINLRCRLNDSFLNAMVARCYEDGRCRSVP